jgi:hypothetical protein
MTYAEQLERLRATDPRLVEEISGLRNLEEILKWVPKAGIPFSGLDLVQQDEYSYDLLLPLSDNLRWLSLGVS